MTLPAFAAHAAQAMDATYALYGVPAIWTPDGGAAIPGVTVIKTAPTDDFSMGRGQAREAKTIIRVRRAEVAAVGEGDQVAIGSDTFAILADPVADDFGLEWICEAAPARLF